MEDINLLYSFQKGKSSKKLTSVYRNSLSQLSNNSIWCFKLESSTISGKNNSYKLELITQNFTDNYEGKG